jgi:hypothetical protein
MAWSEQQVRNRLMRKYIDMDPITVVLRRPIWSITSAGGRVITGETVLEAQKFSFMPFKRRLTIELAKANLKTGEDETSLIEYVLIGIPGESDIAKNDYFLWTDELVFQPGRYEVNFVQARRHDHLQAGIIYRGPDATN